LQALWRKYALAYMANQGMVNLRRRLFETLQAAPVSLFSPVQSASKLSNTVVYEVQTGTTLLVNAMLSLLKDSLTSGGADELTCCTSTGSSHSSCCSSFPAWPGS
jgi:hypothetical protein